MHIGPWEILLLLIIVLIIFGPGRLPEISRAVGKSIREFRQATQELTEPGENVGGSGEAQEKESSGKSPHQAARE